MTDPIATGAVHHVTLTVSDLRSSIEFYTTLLSFQVAAELSPTRVLISNGTALMALTLPPDPSQAISDDQFNENRLGLDHLSFDVGTRDALESAVRLFDENGVSHGEIKDIGNGMNVLAFRDPDNIQLELTSSHE